MLRSTAMVEDDLTTENPNPPHPLFSIYGRLLKGIASPTMYRSVLSTLERALDRIETQLLDRLVVSSPFSDSWFSFVNVIEDRIAIKVQWDSQFINICSYFDCPESDSLSDPELRWSVCSGCRISHYCGQRCQMADWKRHRIKSPDIFLQKWGTPLLTPVRRYLLAGSFSETFALSSGSKPLSSTTDEEVLSTRLDYRSVPVESKVITVEDARREYELHCQWFGGDQEKVPTLLKEVRGRKGAKLPLAMALYPYGLLTGARIGFNILAPYLTVALIPQVFLAFVSNSTHHLNQRPSSHHNSHIRHTTSPSMDTFTALDIIVPLTSSAEHAENGYSGPGYISDSTTTSSILVDMEHPDDTASSSPFGYCVIA
ncbi:hypothetical protein C8R41DRAFT_985245 [Lentinula lateritia]|uniref:MYND-type domain-containing protein n=1 Tax=Lentinula lateritia TaxID=40482 RepID=A0ABQ8UXV3_9AGAR|nr:hypothetical protein C8R41DRAFT_985245 [Lentinula lateritia]